MPDGRAPVTPQEGFTLLFVYGTLRHGFGNHHFLDNSQFMRYSAIAHCTLFECMLTGLPKLIVTGNPGDVVEGEIYMVPNRAMRLIGMLESAYTPHTGTTQCGTEVLLYVWTKGLTNCSHLGSEFFPAFH